MPKCPYTALKGKHSTLRGCFANRFQVLFLDTEEEGKDQQPTSHTYRNTSKMLDIEIEYKEIIEPTIMLLVKGVSVENSSIFALI